MKRLNSKTVAVVFALFVTRVWAVDTNMQRLEKMYFDLCRNALASVNISDTNAVILKSGTAIDYNWFIEKQLVACLRSFNFKNIYSDAQVEDALTLHYRPVEHSIQYQKIGRKKFERHINLQLYMRLMDSKSIILKDDIFQTTFTDSVVSGEIKAIENPKYPFTYGERNRSLFKKIYEPLMITAVTGWIIYLLYSYRSQ